MKLERKTKYVDKKKTNESKIRRRKRKELRKKISWRNENKEVRNSCRIRNCRTG